jgi:NAD(P) transhydrogenase subunit alpha
MNFLFLAQADPEYATSIWSESAQRVARAAQEGAVEISTQSGNDLTLLFFIFVIAAFLGFELISKVPSQLHTPLMSGSNAISGVTIVGAIVAAGHGAAEWVTVTLGTLAVITATINVVGGYLVTDRMLGMFRKKEQ